MILGCVAGFGMSCDAHHLTAPDPAGQGAALAMQRALFQANFSPEDIGCVNAHGTGTPLNDAAEIAGIERVFGAYARECPVHSVKASTGHCLGAAGALEAIVALLTLHHGVVPPTAGLVDCEFDGRVDCVRDQVRPLAKQRVLSNSFGFGGNNTSLILAHSECYR
jgi:3-oxoacyl-[acyl-carrier-protein] synthase II